MNSHGRVAIFLIILIFLISLLAIPVFRNFVFRSLLPNNDSQKEQNLAPSTSNPTLKPSFNAASDQFGVAMGLAGNDPYVVEATQKAAQAGIGWIRIQCDWRNIETSDNVWDWSQCDSAVNQATKVGLKPLVLLWLDSTWCRMAPKDNPQAKAKPVCTDEQFTDYITQVVNRYKGRVSHYEIGNEPDLMSEWRDGPSQYAKTLHLAYTAIKKVDPNTKVLNGGLAACSGQNCSKEFAPAIVKDPNYPALQNLDIVNYHTYAKKSDMALLYNNIRSVVGSKPIWVTEVGFPSHPEYQEKRRPGYGYPSGEEGQSAYLKDVLPYLLSLGVEKVFWYGLVDVPKDKSEFCTYGLMYIPGKQCGQNGGGELKTKKAFDAYKEILKAR